MYEHLKILYFLKKIINIFIAIDSLKYDYSLVKLYFEYFSYIHDIPLSLIESTHDKFRKPSLPFKKYYDLRGYVKSLVSSYSTIHDSKINAQIYSSLYNTSALTIPSNILDKKVEFGLYTMTLKQMTPLIEFLCYYRIIESISQGKNINWINNNIDKIYTHNFGKLEIFSYFDDVQVINNLDFYKKLAIERINSLKIKFSNIGIYFYKDLRCNIPHGKSKDVKRETILTDPDTLYKNVYILKLLSRIAIEK